jgi:hypothetical protein
MPMSSAPCSAPPGARQRCVTDRWPRNPGASLGMETSLFLKDSKAPYPMKSRTETA